MQPIEVWSEQGRIVYSTLDELLARYKSDINQYINFSTQNYNSNVYTILGKIIQQNSLPLLNQLLRHPVNVNKGVDRWNRHPLELAFDHARTEIIERLLEYPSIKVHKKIRPYNDSILIVACKRGYTNIIRKLLMFSTTDINYKNKQKQTALSMAATEGHLEIVQLLLANSALDRTAIRIAVKTAALHKHLPILKACVAAQTSDKKLNRSCRRALLYAYREHNLEIIHYLETLVRVQSKDLYYKKYYNQEWTRDPYWKKSIFEHLVQIGEKNLVEHILETYKPPKHCDAYKLGLNTASQTGNISLVQRFGKFLPPLEFHTILHETLFKSYNQPLALFEEYIHFPLLNLNYINNEGFPFITMIAKNASMEYMHALLKCPSINLYTRDAQDRTPYLAAWVWCSDFRNVPLLRNAIKTQERNELKGLTELCLFSVIPLPHDIQRIIGAFVITDFSKHLGRPPPKKIAVRKVLPPLAVPLPVAAVEEEEEAEEEELGLREACLTGRGRGSHIATTGTEEKSSSPCRGTRFYHTFH